MEKEAAGSAAPPSSSGLLVKLRLRKTAAEKGGYHPDRPHRGTEPQPDYSSRLKAHHPSGPESNKKPGLRIFGREDAVDEAYEKSSKSELYRNAIEVLTEAKQGQFHEEEKTSIPSEKYMCDICGKSFETHQALGGHRSSHNKFKLTIVNTRDRDRNPVAIKNKKRKTITSNGGGKVVLEIDLNMMPEEEDDVNGDH